MNGCCAWGMERRPENSEPLYKVVIADYQWQAFLLLKWAITFVGGGALQMSPCPPSSLLLLEITSLLGFLSRNKQTEEKLSIFFPQSNLWLYQHLSSSSLPFPIQRMRPLRPWHGSISPLCTRPHIPLSIQRLCSKKKKKPSFILAQP